MKTTPLRLQHGSAILEVVPQAGGCVARYAVHRDAQVVELMRRAKPQAIADGDSKGMSCFPLFPYSGRIRDGRFEFAGGRIQERLNFKPTRHAIHGHAWQYAWQLEREAPDRLGIVYRHGGGPWPFPYSARQQFRLDGDALEVDITLRNEGSKPMPSGFGLHPYFPRTARATVRADVGGVWLSDGEVLPTERVSVPKKWPMATGVAVSATALDNIFTGWRGKCVLAWPEIGVRLELTASDVLGHLVLYTPPGEDFFCVEPVSHCADAFNLANAGVTDTGMQVLGPGESLAAWVRFEPHFD